MSNRRKVRDPGAPPAERCTFCRGALGRGHALRFRTGQVACARCRENGGIQPLACGHLGVAGALKVNENGDGKTFVCGACATRADEFGIARLGLGGG